MNNSFVSSILFSFTTKTSWVIVCQGENSYSAQNSSFELCNLEDTQKCFAWYHLEGSPYITYYRRGKFLFFFSDISFINVPNITLIRLCWRLQKLHIILFDLSKRILALPETLNKDNLYFSGLHLHLWRSYQYLCTYSI